jgi:hypothetical protein
VVQGSGPHGLLATLYFDRQSGLLVRLVRSAHRYVAPQGLEGASRSASEICPGKESCASIRAGPYGPVPAAPVLALGDQVDFGDYRDVGGIKMPFRVMFAWLDGRDAIQLNQIQTNVPVDLARFSPPVSSK